MIKLLDQIGDLIRQGLWLRSKSIRGRFRPSPAERRLASQPDVVVPADDIGRAARALSLQHRSQAAEVALSNTAEAISVVSIERQGLTEVRDLLASMMRAAELAADDETTPARRDDLQQQVVAARDQLDRIAQRTSVGYGADRVALLDGSTNELEIVASPDPNTPFTVRFRAVTAEALAIDTLSIGTRSNAATALDDLQQAVDVVERQLGVADQELASLLDQNRVLSIHQTIAQNAQRIALGELSAEGSDRLSELIRVDLRVRLAGHVEESSGAAGGTAAARSQKPLQRRINPIDSLENRFLDHTYGEFLDENKDLVALFAGDDDGLRQLSATRQTSREALHRLIIRRLHERFPGAQNLSAEDLISRPELTKLLAVNPGEIAARLKDPALAEGILLRTSDIEAVLTQQLIAQAGSQLEQVGLSADLLEGRLDLSVAILLHPDWLSTFDTVPAGKDAQRDIDRAQELIAKFDQLRPIVEREIAEITQRLLGNGSLADVDSFSGDSPLAQLLVGLDQLLPRHLGAFILEERANYHDLLNIDDVLSSFVRSQAHDRLGYDFPRGEELLKENPGLAAQILFSPEVVDALRSGRQQLAHVVEHPEQVLQELTERLRD